MDLGKYLAIGAVGLFGLGVGEAKGQSIGGEANPEIEVEVMTEPLPTPIRFPRGWVTIEAEDYDGHIDFIDSPGLGPREKRLVKRLVDGQDERGKRLLPYVSYVPEGALFVAALGSWLLGRYASGKARRKGRVGVGDLLDDAENPERF